MAREGERGRGRQGGSRGEKRHRAVGSERAREREMVQRAMLDTQRERGGGC